jgi:hypothetical protein
MRLAVPEGRSWVQTEKRKESSILTGVLLSYNIRITDEKLISTTYHGHAMTRDPHSGSQLPIGGKFTWCWW